MREPPMPRDHWDAASYDRVSLARRFGPPGRGLPREYRSWLNHEDTTFPSTDALADFLRTVVLWPYTERLPEPERAGFVAEVVGRLPGLVLDDVRLNIVARMPEKGDRVTPVAVRRGRYH